MSFIEEWERGENIPSYQEVRKDSLKTFFLLDYVDPTEEEIIKIWNGDNEILRWRLFSLFNIFLFEEKLNPKPLDEIIRLQLIESRISDDSRLTSFDRDYLKAKGPNPNFVKLYPNRTVSKSLYKSFIEKNDFSNQKYFKPADIDGLSLEFLDYLCLVKAKYQFTDVDFKSIPDEVSMYVVLSKTKDSKLWEYVDFARDFWAISSIPDAFAYFALLQNTDIFVREIASVKTRRFYLQSGDNFYKKFLLPKTNYPQWSEIKDKLIDKGNNSPLYRRYSRTPLGKEETRLREIREKENERNREEALRQEKVRLAAERQAALLDKLHEEQVQRTIDEKERAKALYEKINVATAYQEAVRSGFGTSSFGRAVAYFGLSQKFTCDELKRAYRRKSLQAHPDKPGGSRDEFDRVTNYYHLLEHLCKK